MDFVMEQFIIASHIFIESLRFYLISRTLLCCAKNIKNLKFPAINNGYF